MDDFLTDLHSDEFFLDENIDFFAGDYDYGDDDEYDIDDDYDPDRDDYWENY